MDRTTASPTLRRAVEPDRTIHVAFHNDLDAGNVRGRAILVP
jgi:hypothetical protein